MNLQTVTITGVDSSIPLGALLALSREFPFVEWGVLLSQAAGAHPKYPDHDWVASLCRFARAHGIAVSGHVCGAWTQQVLGGEWPSAMECLSFRRLQLNISKVSDEALQPGRWIHLLPAASEVIVQFNHRKPRFDPVALVDELERAGHAASVLLDASGGRGIESAGWPAPPPVGKVGYAGGLKPENIESHLEQIATATAGCDQTIWLDMESGVRTCDGLLMDLDRVRQCLAKAAAYVQPPSSSGGV